MVSTERIVNEPVKIDLHIHSVASSHRDGEKVKDGTISNIGTLLKKLEKYEVNMVAITDHDAFDYSMYSVLREKVKGAQSLRRVLPGVEFTVSFKTAEGEKPVHVVTIFDDTDQDRVRGIENAIPFKDGKPAYDVDHAFSEEKYWLFCTLGR